MSLFVFGITFSAVQESDQLKKKKLKKYPARSVNKLLSVSFEHLTVFLHKMSFSLFCFFFFCYVTLISESNVIPYKRSRLFQTLPEVIALQYESSAATLGCRFLFLFFFCIDTQTK